MADANVRAHLDWLGLIQPVGLVVAPTALVTGGAVLPGRVIEERERLQRFLRVNEDTGAVALSSLKEALLHVLEWPEELLVSSQNGQLAALETPVPEYADTLLPTFAVRDPSKSDTFLMLIKEVTQGADLDATGREEGHGRWHASHQARLERLLRETGVSIGLLSNGHSVRLVYAPKGESSGHLTFPFKALIEPQNHPMLGALLMLLRADRLFTLPDDQRLPALLVESRRYQNQVTEELAAQVLAALHELLSGLQVADKAVGGALLGDVVRNEPQLIYEGLVSVIMRMVFLLFAEERGVMPQDEKYQRNYSLVALFEQLREDEALHPDTMDLRYGAWARLLAAFRIIFHGVKYSVGGLEVRVPGRQGDLFNPDRFNFLEGRRVGSSKGERNDLLLIPDGTVLRVLKNLLILDGERLSYRALDVEQIGSVYEALMGFELATATGVSMALNPEHVVVDLDALVRMTPANREKTLVDDAGVKLTGEALKALKAAKDVAGLKAALERRRSRLTPRDLHPGDLYFRVTDERRRSGSHYTPRSLTEPIVEKTLRPLVDALGPRPVPSQILALKVCDPAMGSGAFLVAACRWLGDRLLAAWQEHNALPTIPLDEDAILHARRIVALNCLYGVDKNPFAVNLAKLSLWLVTLARNHSFTFLDHALKLGDSLVGLDLGQISSLSWEPGPTGETLPIAGKTAREAVKAAEASRADLRALGDTETTEKAVYFHRLAEDAAEEAKRIGDTIISAFFSADSPRGRAAKLKEMTLPLLDKRLLETPELGDIHPFHWQLEFPEVFDRENAGFDAFVGNPPFAGKNGISEANGELYLPWLQTTHVGAHGNADLSAHFFRRCHSLAGKRACIGLLATNTIAQGDTRATGLQPIVNAGTLIYDATRSLPWPGLANVAVSVVHLAKGVDSRRLARRLDGKPADAVNSRLRAKPEQPDPVVLKANERLSFQGSIVLGMGFTLTPDEREALLRKNPRNAERIFPYLGGEEVNTSPTQSFDRYVISFGEMSLEEAERWPDLVAIVREKVKPDRDAQKDRSGKEYWWRFLRPRAELYAAIKPLKRCLVTARVTKHLCFSFQPTDRTIAETAFVFAIEDHARFATLQSRVHEPWARLLSSSMRNDLRYSGSDCFETFPFPKSASTAALEVIGAKLYETRAQYMVETSRGLTATYNQLKDMDCTEPRIQGLRALHEQLDRAVLDAYGWTDIAVPPYVTPRDDAGRRALERFEDDVIDRLFALNAERAAEERRVTATPAKKSTRKKQ